MLVAFGLNTTGTLNPYSQEPLIEPTRVDELLGVDEIVWTSFGATVGKRGKFFR
jgi:hypothetical protein